MFVLKQTLSYERGGELPRIHLLHDSFIHSFTHLFSYLFDNDLRASSVFLAVIAVIGVFASLSNYLALLCLVESHDHTALYQTAGESESWEIIFIAKLLKANNAINCDAFNEDNHGWDHLYLEFLDEEGSLLNIHVDELSLGVTTRDFSQMHINNLASLEVLVIEVTHDKLAASDSGQELLFCDLFVLTVALN